MSGLEKYSGQRTDPGLIRRVEREEKEHRPNPLLSFL